jgi:hypothetical protein
LLDRGSTFNRLGQLLPIISYSGRKPECHITQR